jgi:hypothetical protein
LKINIGGYLYLFRWDLRDSLPDGDSNTNTPRPYPLRHRRLFYAWGYSLSSTGEKDAMQWLEPCATDNEVRLENATVKGRKIN